MLYTLFPIPLIAASITPIHFSIAMPHIIEVVPLIGVSTRPCKYAIATFFVVSIFSLIFIGLTWSSLPYSIAMPQTIFEIAFEKTAVGPIIFSIA